MPSIIIKLRGAVPVSSWRRLTRTFRPQRGPRPRSLPADIDVEFPDAAEQVRNRDRAGLSKVLRAEIDHRAATAIVPRMSEPVMSTVSGIFRLGDSFARLGIRAAASARTDAV